MGLLTVFHKGDEEKGIKGTGKKRQMSEEQFERLKSKGWAKMRGTSKPSEDDKPGTSDDSGTKGNEGGDETILDLNVTQAVAKIKELGDAEKIEELKAFVSLELSQEEPRATIVNAIAKYLPQEGSEGKSEE